MFAQRTFPSAKLSFSFAVRKMATGTRRWPQLPGRCSQSAGITHPTLRTPEDGGSFGSELLAKSADRSFPKKFKKMPPTREKRLPRCPIYI